MYVRDKLKTIFESVGIYLGDNEFNKELELDSLQFVTIIIEIETQFLIRISNDFEEYSELNTFNDFYRMVNFYFEE